MGDIVAEADKLYFPWTFQLGRQDTDIVTKKSKEFVQQGHTTELPGLREISSDNL